MSGFLRCKIRAIKRDQRLNLTESEKERQALNFKAASCDGKRPYESFGEAEKCMSRNPDGKPPGKLHAYKCDICKKFHVGHTVRFTRPVSMAEV